MRRLTRTLIWVLCFGALIVSAQLSSFLSADSGDVTELAPGVFFREQTEGCNNGWIVFKDYVLVVDANFPEHAAKVVEAIKKTTDKPIKFVFDTHYHGDHAFGNAIYTNDGAVAVATETCLLQLLEKGHPAFEEEKVTRADYRKTYLANPTVLFDTKIIFDDGDKRVELLYNGHAHTAGDAVAYLPKEKILFTGDSVVDGPFNYTGDSNTESWIKVIDRLKKLDINTVAPGHGALSGPELLDLQQRYFIELRGTIQKYINNGKSLDEIKASIDLPFYEKWTGVPVRDRVENIEHVFSELGGNG